MEAAETRTSASARKAPNVESIAVRERVAAVVRDLVIHGPATTLAVFELGPLNGGVGSRPGRDVSGRGPVVNVSAEREQGRAGIVGLSAGQSRAVGNGGQAGCDEDENVGEHFEGWRLVVGEN